jgi:hypothetical protein
VDTSASVPLGAPSFPDRKVCGAWWSGPPPVCQVTAAGIDIDEEMMKFEQIGETQKHGGKETF